MAVGSTHGEKVDPINELYSDYHKCGAADGCLRRRGRTLPSMHGSGRRRRAFRCLLRLCAKNITGRGGGVNITEPKLIWDSPNDSTPYAPYLYIISQCSRSLPQTYSVSSHAKKTFPPSLSPLPPPTHRPFSFPWLRSFARLPRLAVFPFKTPCQLQRTQVYGSVINSTNKRAYWDHRKRCGSLLSPRL